MDIPRDDELEAFLKKVDEIESVVKGLNSEASENVDNSMKKADELISKLKSKDDEIEVEGVKTKTGINRTVINKYTNSEPSVNDMVTDTRNLSQDAFKDMLERDANERYKRKQESLKIANELKATANQFFKEENYEKAIELYTEAIQKVRDQEVFYTNRAQAFIKIGEYNKAIEDCEWALRVNENSVKARIHKGRAFTYLKEFEKAHEQFEEAKKIDQDKSKIIDDYIRELEISKNAYNQELAVKTFLENNTDKSNNKNGKEYNKLDDFIETLTVKLKDKKNQHLFMYYSGGLRYLANLCTDETTRTLFRTNGGFDLLKSHEFISKNLVESINLEKISAQEIDVIGCVFCLLLSVCSNSDENIQYLFKTVRFGKVIDNVLHQINLRLKNTQEIRTLNLELSAFLENLSEREFGCSQLIINLDSEKLIEYFIKNFNSQNKNSIKVNCLNALKYLILESRFQNKLKKENVHSITEALFKNENYKINWQLSGVILHAITCNQNFKSYIVDLDCVWDFLRSKLEYFGSNNDKENDANIIVSILVNLTGIKSENLELNAKNITRNILKLIVLKNSENECLILLGNMIQSLSNKQQIFDQINEDVIANLVNNITSKVHLKSTVKILALCTQTEIKFRNLLIKLDKKLDFLYEQFKGVSTNVEDGKNDKKVANLKKLDEVLISNSVLCLSYCVDENKPLADRLTTTNIIMDLLYIIRDGNKKDLQKNCGILIAKLVKLHEKHLLRLRELHGIEILHSSLNNSI